MDPTPNTEAELESFRQLWKEEVIARAKGKPPAPPAPPSPTQVACLPSKPRGTDPDTSPRTHARQHSGNDVDEVPPHVGHDLGEKQHGRRLDETNAQTAAALSASQEPESALEYYEKAVEKETQGSLGDSVNLYRKAFRVGSAHDASSKLLLLTCTARLQSARDLQGKTLPTLVFYGKRRINSKYQCTTYPSSDKGTPIGTSTS